MRLIAAFCRLDKPLSYCWEKGWLVGAVRIDNYTTSQKPRKQRRCNRSYWDNHYDHYKTREPGPVLVGHPRLWSAMPWRLRQSALLRFAKSALLRFEDLLVKRAVVAALAIVQYRNKLRVAVKAQWAVVFPILVSI
jgi:hypothetical protein